MAEQTLIEWADATLNLWWGCTKVSEGCKFCYAENLSEQRFGRGAWGPQGQRREVKSWRSTLEKISRRAEAEGRGLRVFCQSMSDTFEGPETCGGEESENWQLMLRLREELWDVWEDYSYLDFLVLTKRPENAAEWLKGLCIPGNVWIGTSVEDQKTADERIPKLLEIDCAVRFVSCEPLLGPVDLAYTCFNGADSFGAMPGIHWVICGGESGPNARPMHPDWARRLRDECQAAGVPFLFKQWGEWGPRRTDNVVHDENLGQLLPMVIASSTDRKQVGTKLFHAYPSEREEPPGAAKSHPGRFSYFDEMNKVGKKAAGRLLDGREWNELPGWEDA